MKNANTNRKNIFKLIGISLVLAGISMAGWITYNTLFTHQGTEHIRGLDYDDHNHSHNHSHSADYEEAYSHPILKHEQVYDSENFRIHYTLKGKDKVEASDDNNNGTPDYVEDVAQFAEEVKAKQLELGWAHPPKDGNWGGNDLYDIYLLAETEGGGFVDSGAEETIVGDNPFTPDVKEKTAAFSYMAIGPRYEETSLKKSRDFLKVLLAHEYHHAIQFGYDAHEPTDWLWEGGASWMEERLYDGLDSSHETLESVFKSTDSCQASYGGETRIEDDGRVYGMWIYLQYLAERYNPEIVRAIWEEARFKDSYDALDAVLKPYGTTTEQSFKDFMVSLLTRNFEEGKDFPTVRLEATVTSDGFTSSRSDGGGIGQLAADFVEFDFFGTKNIVLNADNLEGQIIGIKNNQASVFDLARAGITVNADNFDKLYLVIFNPERPSDEASCSISNYSIALSPATNQQAVAQRVETVRNFATPEVEGLIEDSDGFFAGIANSVVSAFGQSSDVTTIHPPATLVPSYLPASLELSEAYTEMYEGTELTILEYYGEGEDDYLSIVAEEAPSSNLREIFEQFDYDLSEVDVRKLSNTTVFFETFVEDGDSIQMASFIKEGQFLEMSSNLSQGQLIRVVASLL